MGLTIQIIGLCEAISCIGVGVGKQGIGGRAHPGGAVDLGSGVFVAAALILGTVAPFVDRIGETAEHQLHGAHGVVVAGDRHVAEIRIAVRVEHRDQGNVELAALEHGVGFATLIHQTLHGSLRAPVARVGARYTPVPFSQALEGLHFPTEARIAAAARALVKQ